MIPILAVISGKSLLYGFAFIVIAALIFYALNWCISYMALGEPWTKILRVLLVLVAVILLVNFLLGLMPNGHGFITW